MISCPTSLDALYSGNDCACITARDGEDKVIAVNDTESCIFDEAYSPGGSEWECRVHSDDEEVVMEHVFLLLDSYLSMGEEEQCIIDMDCTIWTVYDEDNAVQHIVDGEPTIIKETL